MKENTAEDRTDAEEEMSEAQRLKLLEKGVNLNRVLLLLLALLTIIFLSVSSTLIILAAMEDDEIPVVESQVTELKDELTALQLQVSELNKQLATHEKTLPELKRHLENSSGPALLNLMLAQEASYQTFLDALNAGTLDLARMVPGSRTWYELYSEKIEFAKQQSQQRSRMLQLLKQGQPLPSLDQGKANPSPTWPDSEDLRF